MIKLTPVVVALVLALLIPGTAAAATGPYLVRDIDTNGSSSPIELTAMDDVLYFNAKGGAKGRELWRSDGTFDGTRRVKDIRPGTGGGSPWNLAAIGGLLYFSADDGVNGRELWVSDGTGIGTRLVKDINPGGDSTPFHFTAFNGSVYFSASDGTTGRELWRTDGTTGGTARVKDIVPGATSSNPGALTPFGDKLLFTITAGSVNPVDTLYRTDGTATGTKPFRDGAGHKITGQGVNWLTVAESRLFFIVNETELWRSNGTQATTKRIAQMNAWELVDVGSRVFFHSGEELWKSDGTAATTNFVANFTNSGVGASHEFNGELFFFAFGEPWLSDGTPAGTHQIGKQVQADTEFAIVGSTIYFGGYATDDDFGARPAGQQAFPSFTPAPTLTLWRSDGTAAGTYSVGPPDANMHSVVAVGDSIFFAANADGAGTELWRYVP